MGRFRLGDVRPMFGNFGRFQLRFVRALPWVRRQLWWGNFRLHEVGVVVVVHRHRLKRQQQGRPPSVGAVFQAATRQRWQDAGGGGSNPPQWHPGCETECLVRE